MEILRYIVYALMLLSALGIIGLVLLQHGKGADMGTGFGAGASGSLFGATGSANFLSRSTAVLAAVFFVSTLALSWFAGSRPSSGQAPAGGLPVQVLPGSAPETIPGEGAPGPARTPSAAPAPADRSGEIPK